MLLRKTALVFFLILLVRLNHAQAHQPADPDFQKYLETVKNTVWVCSDVSKIPADRRTRIYWEFKSGQPNFQINEVTPSGDQTADFECYESVCAASLVLRRAESSTVGPDAEMTFKEPELTQMKASNGDDAISGVKPYSVHLIPMSTLIAYPGLFKREELRSVSNRIQLFQDSSNVSFHEKCKKVRTIYAAWAKFFNSSKTPTREDIQREAARIRQTFKPEN